MATKIEATNMLNRLRGQLDNVVAAEVDNPAIINAIPDGIRPWTQGIYEVNDVRMHFGNPYKCIQAHDSTNDPSWNPVDAASLWIQYHGTSKETARAWVAPTGAHDMYLDGEYMIFTDGLIYRCKENTAYDPVTYPQAWEAQTQEAVE